LVEYQTMIFELFTKICFIGFSICLQAKTLTHIPSHL